METQDLEDRATEIVRQVMWSDSDQYHYGIDRAKAILKNEAGRSELVKKGYMTKEEDALLILADEIKKDLDNRAHDMTDTYTEHRCHRYLETDHAMSTLVLLVVGMVDYRELARGFIDEVKEDLE